jgi:DnaK suppressor protein
MKRLNAGAADENQIKNRLVEFLTERARKTCIEEVVHTIGNQADTLDLAATYRDREIRIRLMEREGELFQEVAMALHRLELGRYGICEHCGEEIDINRLLASPATTLCIECKKIEEVRKKGRVVFLRRTSILPAEEYLA